MSCKERLVNMLFAVSLLTIGVWLDFGVTCLFHIEDSDKVSADTAVC